jgi:uncharacterized protein (DUF924 family)
MTNVPPVPQWTGDVVHFWFSELRPESWFTRDESVDATIRKRFGALHASLTEKVPASVTATPHGALAAVIVLDQFSRNLFRNSSRAFACDATALAIAQEAIKSGFDRELERNQRAFLYLPFEHCEDRAMQQRSIELFTELGDANALSYARQHQEIIERFGRFPHRNRVLGRESTREELEFLKTHPGF